ncbi:MAG: hypothetical protein C0506_02895 [Anaerolinea sp.]|nr:hypothetical protein [Anaerolinea sp.]
MSGDVTISTWNGANSGDGSRLARGTSASMRSSGCCSSPAGHSSVLGEATNTTEKEQNASRCRFAGGLYCLRTSATCSNGRVRKAMTDDEREDLIHEIVSRPYRKVISGDDIDGYLAEAPELPGCVTAGETVEEALVMLRDAMEGWIECALVAGDPIPEPEAMRLSA